MFMYAIYPEKHKRKEEEIYIFRVSDHALSNNPVNALIRL